MIISPARAYQSRVVPQASSHLKNNNPTSPLNPTVADSINFGRIPGKLKTGLQAMADTLVKEDGFPGAMLLWKGPQGSWQVQSGLSHTETGQTLSGDQSFYIASITKPMIAAMTLQLVAEGKLQLDQSYKDVLPQHLKAGFEKLPDATIKELLQHTSGLPEFLYQKIAADCDKPPYEAVSQENVWAMLPTDPSVHNTAPAKRGKFGYCNTNYEILGAIIEQLTGKSLNDALQERIFSPLQLDQSRFDGSWNDDELVQGYSRSIPGTFQEVAEDPLKNATRWNRAFLQGRAAGGVVTTMADVARFFQQLFIPNKVLPQPMITAMTQPVYTGSKRNDGGLGVFLYKGNGEMPPNKTHAAFWHDGKPYGYKPVVIHNPQKQITLVAMTNADTDKMTVLSVRLNQLFESMDLTQYNPVAGY